MKISKMKWYFYTFDEKLLGGQCYYEWECTNGGSTPEIRISSDGGYASERDAEKAAKKFAKANKIKYRRF